MLQREYGRSAARGLYDNAGMNVYGMEEEKMDIIRAIEKENMKENLPDLRVGDFVRVGVKVKEGTRERLQIFEGYIIGMHGRGVRRAIVVRRLSFGIGVERVFPIHSPKVDNIEIVRRGKVRRAKLYYLRDRVGKQAKIKEDINAKK
jgi:large subunit ribosomal protein L19